MRNPIFSILLIIVLVVLGAYWAFEIKEKLTEPQEKVYILGSDGMLYNLNHLQSSKNGSLIVVEDFKKKFPQATQVEWEMKNETFEVDFEMDRVEREIMFGPSGEILLWKQEITRNELPAKIKFSLQSSFGEGQYDDIYKVEKGGKYSIRSNMKPREKKKY